MKSNDWNWNGARWWKFDLHTHTPGSDDYGKGPNQAALKARLPKDWLLDYMKAGIDCLAVTDHNTGQWIDALKSAFNKLETEKPDGFRPIHLFPGVEISVNGGVHLLAILPLDKKTSDIDSLLGAVGYTGTKGSSNAVTSKSFNDVVEEIVKAGGIAIPAHVDEKSGLFTQIGTTLQQILDCTNIFASEVIDPAFSKPQSYIDKKLCWTEIVGSDAHHPNGNSKDNYPGSRFTWVKMGLPSIEGLRLALLDGSLSVRRSDSVQDNPNKHASLAMESIEISKARYLGRSQPFEIGFNPWLNAIIGGRGTGKSTVVEFLRIALRRQNELPAELKNDFNKYIHVYQKREDSGLLTNDTKIIVTYRKDGSRFRIQWNNAGNIDPIEEEVNGSWQQSQGDIEQRFPVRIYSQKQIFQLAKQPFALLAVVDEAPEVDYRSWEEKKDVEQSRFLSLRAKAREIETGLTDGPRLKGELDDVKRKLTVFEQAGHSDILKTFQKRSRQQREVEVWEKSWADTGKQMREVAAVIVPDLLNKSAFDRDSACDNELQAHAAKVQEQLTGIKEAVDGIAAQSDKIVAQWNKNKDESTWKKIVEDSSKAYRELRDNLERESVEDPAVYGELVQRRQTIEQRLTKLSARKTEVGKIQAQANEHLKKLIEVRRGLTRSREEFLASVLGENTYVKIQVVPYGAQEIVEGKFRQLIQREQGFEKDIGSPDAQDGHGLLSNLYGNNSNGDVIEKNLLEIKQKIKSIAAGQEKAKDSRFADHLKRLAPENFDRLDMWFPEDSLDVQYSSTGDGQKFRSIKEGSPGQKTAALLAFLLSYGEEPLILDQPEDDLDNQLIYDLIVNQLREVKLCRQVIVVTHNANIVVNGDAELVTALASRRGETQKDCDDNLQVKEVRKKVCTIMEGGQEAFEQRYRRIALEGRHV